MIYLLSLLTASISIFAAILELKQSTSNYYDIVALLTVIGGTIAVSIVVIPWGFKTELKACLEFILIGKKHTSKTLLKDVMLIIYMKSSAPTPKRKGLGAEILRDGRELLSLGFNDEKIETILSERILQNYERIHKVSHSVRSLAKYPPAFGLVGTVLGLVSLMRAVSGHANSEEIGMRMAVALVATLYGLLIANLVINPVGERITQFAQQEKKDGELAMQGIILAARNTSDLEAHEVLNSFVSKNDRLILDFSIPIDGDDSSQKQEGMAA